jgi:hypothetical protein
MEFVFFNCGAVDIADKIRSSPELSASLSVRATEEACMYLTHPLMESDARKLLPEILKSSFCGRFSGRFDDVTSDAGAVWTIIQRELRGVKQGQANAET